MRLHFGFSTHVCALVRIVPATTVVRSDRLAVVEGSFSPRTGAPGAIRERNVAMNERLEDLFAGLDDVGPGPRRGRRSLRAETRRPRPPGHDLRATISGSIVVDPGGDSRGGDTPGGT